MPRQSQGRVLAGGDISANEIVVMLERPDGGRERATFPNTPAGHKALIAWLMKRGNDARVVIEATGNYSLDSGGLTHH